MSNPSFLHTSRWANVLAIAACCALLSSLPQSASAQMNQGQWIQLNFTDGWPFPADQPGFNYNGFNFFQALNSGDNGTTGSTALIDSLGNAVPGVTVTASGWQGPGWDPSSNGDPWPDGPVADPPTPANLAGRGDSVLRRDETINFWWDASIDSVPVVTVAGLDPEMAYNIYYYSKHRDAAGAGESHTLDVNGLLQTTAVRGDRFLDIDEDLFFSEVKTNGAGELVFTWGEDSASIGFNPVLNAIIIQAVVPEPATIGLVAGAVVLLGAVKFRRKR